MRSRIPLGALVVGAFVVLLAIGALDLAGDRSVDDRDGSGRVDPVGSLVEAWGRSRSATYRAVGTTVRTGLDGRTLASEAAVVQRPPDRLVRSLGAVSGRRGARVLVCPSPAGGAACAIGSPGPDFTVVVASEVDAFAALVEGPEPLYRVRTLDAGCWRLTRTRFDPRSGFGVATTLCFDAATGAVRRLRTDHGTVVEETIYDEIGGTVADEDLEP